MSAIEAGIFGRGEGMRSLSYHAVATAEPVAILLDAQSSYAENLGYGTVLFTSSMVDAVAEISGAPVTSSPVDGSTNRTDSVRRFLDNTVVQAPQHQIDDITRHLPDPSVREFSPYVSADLDTKTVNLNGIAWHVGFQPAVESVGTVKRSGGGIYPVDGMVTRRDLQLVKTDTGKTFADIMMHVVNSPENQAVYGLPGKVIKNPDGTQEKLVTKRVSLQEAEVMQFSHVLATIREEHEDVPASFSPQYPQERADETPDIQVFNAKKQTYEPGDRFDIATPLYGAQYKFNSEQYKRDVENELNQQYPFPGLPRTVWEGSKPLSGEWQFDPRYQLVDFGPFAEEEGVVGRIISPTQIKTKDGEVKDVVKEKFVKGKIKGRTYWYDQDAHMMVIDEYVTWRKKGEAEPSGDPNLLLFGRMKKNAPDGGDEIVIQRYLPVQNENSVQELNFSGKLQPKQQQKAA